MLISPHQRLSWNEAWTLVCSGRVPKRLRALKYPPIRVELEGLTYRSTDNLP